MGETVHTREPLPAVDDGTHHIGGRPVRVTHRERVRATELLADVDGKPLGIADVGSVTITIGDVEE